MSRTNARENQTQEDIYYFHDDMEISCEEVVCAERDLEAGDNNNKDMTTADKRNESNRTNPFDMTAAGKRNESSRTNPFDTSVSSTSIFDRSARSAPSSSSSSSSEPMPPLVAFKVRNLEDEYKYAVLNVSFYSKEFSVVILLENRIKDLKDELYKLTKVPSHRQIIRGWSPSKIHEARNPEALLKDLLKMTPTSTETKARTGTGTGTGNEVFTELTLNDSEYDKNHDKCILNIFKMPEERLLRFCLSGLQRIKDVKICTYSLTGIPVRKQKWSGWPHDSNNLTSLADCMVKFRHIYSQRHHHNDYQGLTVELLKSDVGPKHVTHCNDGSGSSCSRDHRTLMTAAYLISDQIDDESMGTAEFIKNYEQTYGRGLCPRFFQGSLIDVVNEASNKSPKERKLLTIYLHHGNSFFSDIFCRKVLSCKDNIDMLDQNCLLYGWDMTFESNRNLFLSLMLAYIGETASQIVRKFPFNRYPVMMFIGKRRSTYEVLNVIQGNTKVREFGARLAEAIRLYSEVIKVEIKEYNERESREKIKREQDLAYQTALEADKAKEVAKKQKEIELEIERKHLEHRNAELEAKRQAAQHLLPNEPSPNESIGVIKIKIRKCDGTFLERKFYESDKVQDLLNFMVSQGFPLEQYKILRWPRHDLTAVNPVQAFKDLKMYRQETLFMEEY